MYYPTENIEKLEWDSAFFGINIGKLTIHNEKDFDPLFFLNEIRKGDFSLVYVFKFQKMLTWGKVLSSNLKLVDIQTTMSMKFNKENYKNLPYLLRSELTQKEKSESYKIAEDTSVVSRFFNETKIGESKTKELYRKWIDNALNRTFADGLFLEKENGIVSGIHVHKTDLINKIGFFPLTGVASENKRKGIGKKLWEQALAYWANESEIEIIKSTFSFQNAESLNFHLKMGFNKIEEIKYIYHFSNESK